MRFELLQPTTIAEALSLLAKYQEKCEVIAGGTDLVVRMREKVIKPGYVIDINNIPGLSYVNCDEKQGLKIGALTTIRSLEKSKGIKTTYPVISQAAAQLGSIAIRNVGTVGGNLCNAAPSAEMAPALIGLSARVKVIGSGGERVVPLENFFTGPNSTILKPDELLTEIQVPLLSPNSKGIYLKHGIRGSMDLGIVGVAVIMTMAPTDDMCQDIRIVLGAVAPTPMRARNAEEILRGKRVDDVLVSKSVQAASQEARPISDVRASAEYRREMIRVFSGQALRTVWQGESSIN
jgi:carbon-monoxide dehydrogenase medium subunit